MSKSTGAHKNKDSEAVTPFAEGELGNVQKFLFAEPISRLMDEIQVLNQHLRTLERTVTQDIKKLNERCDQEIAAREQAIESLMQQSTASKTDLSNSISDFTQKSVEADERLQQALNTAVNQLDNSLLETREYFEDKLAASAAKLDTQKVDRKALSGLLGGIAMQIEAEEVAEEEAQSA